MHKITRALLSLTLLLGLFGSASFALAEHSWDGLHWARTTPSFTLKMGNNLSAAWKPYAVSAANDWSASEVVDIAIVAGKTTPKPCNPRLGRVELCNARYGANGWMGLTSVWTNGEHITQATLKVNDTYFSQRAYNTAAWKNLVMCHEMGHTLGLDHQDEDFYNTPLGTCLDYSSDPVPNQHPNQADYDQLALSYNHLDTTTTVAGATVPSSSALDAEVTEDPSTWGKEVGRSADKRSSKFERDLGEGKKVVTHVFWVDGEGEKKEKRNR